MRVYLEVGAKRVFACALDWPGWCRSGRDVESALAELASYRERYAPVAVEAGVEVPAEEPFVIVEKVAGNATTDFGAPAMVPDADRVAVPAQEARRIAALVTAAWRLLDEVAADAPQSLRKGPRGGGRDRDAVVQHALNAETAYARKLGIRRPEPAFGDAAEIGELRAAIVEALGRPSSGEPLVEKGWPPRYAARRIAWHVLDHAWEIEDRSQP